MMEYWSGVSEGKGFVSNESISSPDIMKNGLMGWELKTPSSYGSNIITGEEAFENQGFVGFGFQETMRKSWDVTNSTKDVSSCRIDGERIIRTPIISTTNAFSGEEDSSSKFSSSVVESTSRDSSLIDLKLGRFADHRDAPMLSSSVPAKRVRLGLSSQTPFCKVHGCNKDLSSSKDYHKRHKVCEIHSKSTKVIVNGIEQRFCQQCSRFHLLVEFDDGKRSCRKRLAGHNERRRKPHVGIHSARAGRLIQSYNGSAGGRFQGSTSTSSSLICQDILCGSLMHPHKYDMNDWSRCIKLEDGADYCPQSAIPITKGHLHPKSLFPHDFEKCYPPFIANGLNSATKKDLNQNPQDLGPPNSVSGSLTHKTSIGNEDFILFDSASTVQGLSGTSASGCALSLLSSQSQNASSHSSGIPMAQPLIISGSHGRYSVNQNSSSHSSGLPLAQPLIVCGSQVHYNFSQSGKLLGVSPHASTSGVSPKFNSTGMNSVEENHFGPIIISDDGDAGNFADGVLFQGSRHMNGKDHLSSGDGPTIDLLQLSSQLQRVEHQRQSMQLKQENGAFCGLRIT